MQSFTAADNGPAITTNGHEINGTQALILLSGDPLLLVLAFAR